MDIKNHTPKLRRFRVSSIGDRWTIFDTHNVHTKLCPKGTTRLEAEKACAQLNDGIDNAKAVPAGKLPVTREFQQAGITRERLFKIDEWDREKEDIIDPLAPHRVATWKTWLPPILRAWSDEVATQCSHGGAKRGTWPIYKIFEVLRTADLATDLDAFKFTDDFVLRNLHEALWPTFDWRWRVDFDITEEEIEHRKVLCIHYLSRDSDRIKSAYFGVSERTYQRQVTAAHNWFAAQSWLRTWMF